MIYKVGLLGANGRMGTEVAGLLTERGRMGEDYFELADAVGEKSTIVAVEGVEIRTLSEPPREPVHVWIDFSHPVATLKLLEQIDSPIVIATTGFSDTEKSFIRSYSERQPVLLTSNTSPGINLVLKMLQALPANPGFDVVLSEEHHKHKKDAPSGTAKTLISALQNLGYSNVPVNVTRAGGVKGIHTIKFISENESIEIKHEAFDRSLFAQGALMAAAFLVKQTKPGLYEMGDVFRE